METSKPAPDAPSLHRFEHSVGTGFQLVAGHIVFELAGDRVLLDTGSPLSFARSGQLSFLEEDFAVPTSCAGRTIDDVARDIRSMPGAPPSFHLDALLGMDLLLGHSIELAWKGRFITILTPAPIPEGYRPPPDATCGVPVEEVGIAGTSVPVVVDTGARVSYLEPSLLAGMAPAGVADDFYLGRRYATFLRRGRLEMWGREVEVAFGALPPELSGLAALGARGILGTDALEAWGDVRLDFPDPERRRRRGRRYPYVSVRYMACAYGTRRVHFLDEGPVAGHSGAVRIVDPEARRRGELTESARRQLIATVQADVARTGFRMGCIFSQGERLQLEPDGSRSWWTPRRREPLPPEPSPPALRTVTLAPAAHGRPGRLLLVAGSNGSEPGPATDAAARRESELEALRSGSIEHLVAFTAPEELDALRASGAFERLAGHAVNVHWIPLAEALVPAVDVPRASGAFRWTASSVDAWLREGESVALDLRGGRVAERFAACTLVVTGRTAADAAATIRAACPGSLAGVDDERFVDRFAAEPLFAQHRRRS
ncbi:MAG: hypothetical protein ACJ79R_13295 [Anaeromyxobacteraceae bacterium]